MSTSFSKTATPVAIVGAGLSGLATAARLSQLGVPSVVYEAQSEPGGRVRTTHYSNGAHLDLGATWFHGTVANAALDLAIESGAMLPPPPPLPEHVSSGDAKVDDYGSLVFATTGIHVQPSGEISKLHPEIPQRIVNQYATELEIDRFDHETDVSVLEATRRATGYPQMTTLERAVLRSRDLLECVINGCSGSTATLSVTRQEDYQVLPGDNVQPGEGGMSTVVAALMSKLKYPQVVLNAEVTSISWGAAADNPCSETVKIGFRDGRKVNTECVVWTPSLNVTKKAIGEGLFDPALPESKIIALNQRDQGVVEKVFAILERPLKDVIAHCAIPVVWEFDMRDGRGGMTSMGWQRSVYALTYDDKKHTICFWLSGDAGVRFGELRSEEKVCQTSKMLTQLLQEEVRVRKVVNSCWALNDFVQGSYSYPRVGCSKDWANAVAKPLPCEETGVLYFAGEMTHARFYSTMHGAIESGYREAERCFRFLERRSAHKELHGDLAG